MVSTQEDKSSAYGASPDAAPSTAPVVPETTPLTVLAVPPTALDSVLLAAVAGLVVARPELLMVAARPAVSAVVALSTLTHPNAVH